MEATILKQSKFRWSDPGLIKARAKEVLHG